jgi:hypothetical protein
VDEIQKRERRSRARGLAKGGMGRGSRSSGGDQGFKKGCGGWGLGGGLAGGGRHAEEEQGGPGGARDESRAVRVATKCALVAEVGGGWDRGGGSRREIEGRLTRGPGPV